MVLLFSWSAYRWGWYGRHSSSRSPESYSCSHPCAIRAPRYLKILCWESVKLTTVTLHLSAKILPQHTRSQTPRVVITLNLKNSILYNFYIIVPLYTFFYIDFSCCTLSTTNACFIQYLDRFSILHNFCMELLFHTIFKSIFHNIHQPTIFFCSV